MYTFPSRIRYSEVDAEGFLKLPALVDYLQDCSTFQSEDVGWGVFRLISSGHAWVVNAWQIDISRLPRLGDQVIVGTNPYEIRGFLGLRNFFMDAEDGERLVVANSVWSYLDIEKGMMERAPEEMKEAYGIGEKLDMDYQSRKLPIPKEIPAEQGEKIEVHTEHLDTNRHVNNGQFIRIALDAAFGDALPKIARVRAEYKKQAHLHDSFYPKIYRDGRLVLVVLGDAEGAPYCTVEATLA
ncbi:MAG: acyl-[acyl-carrier-protein] thioesterase [Lachnospiraceae bacterium]|nr:acyl-[acyl-carrier-protein] thioesterase [Lachnospiraceae bacterium]